MVDTYGKGYKRLRKEMRQVKIQTVKEDQEQNTKEDIWINITKKS